jgi:hypothetical protein
MTQRAVAEREASSLPIRASLTPEEGLAALPPAPPSGVGTVLI